VSAAEHERVLRDDGHAGAQRLQRHRLDVHAVNENAAVQLQFDGAEEIQHKTALVRRLAPYQAHLGLDGFIKSTLRTKLSQFMKQNYIIHNTANSAATDPNTTQAPRLAQSRIQNKCYFTSDLESPWPCPELLVTFIFALPSERSQLMGNLDDKIQHD
jgi:hypothetical protein